MPRLVWLVLHDGRSVVAGCGSSSRDAVANALSQPGRTVTLTSDDAVVHIPSGAIRDFVVVDTRSPVPPATSIYRLMHI